jgi:hypothetical protein
MPLQCNINSKGKMCRFITGIALVIAGLALLLTWALPAGTALAWICTAALFLAGAFVIFEARAGWCIVRAMGFKTPW